VHKVSQAKPLSEVETDENQKQTDTSGLKDGCLRASYFSNPRRDIVHAVLALFCELPAHPICTNCTAALFKWRYCVRPVVCREI